MSRTVLFLTPPDDALPKQFALESVKYGMEFFFSRADVTDWCIAWVKDDRGDVQAWLEHLPSGQQHWLGADAQLAMSSAARLISEWDKLEAAYESLAVQ